MRRSPGVNPRKKSSLQVWMTSLKVPIPKAEQTERSLKVRILCILFTTYIICIYESEWN